MRRALTLALLGLGIARGAASQAVTARLGGELTGFVGSQVIVPVAVDMSASGGEKLGSYTARLTWDPAKLGTCAPFCVNGNFQGNFPAPTFNADSVPQGILKFTAVSPVGVTGLVTVTQLPFTIFDTVGTPLTLSFSEMSAAGTFTNLLPSLTTLSGTICPARGRWGDIDRDGNANSRDALLTLSKVVGLPVDTVMDTVSTAPLVVDTITFDTGLADVNADGQVQSVDALIILSYAVGIDIPGQRVLLLAPSSCGTGSARTLSIFPATAQLAPTQSLPLLLQARDTAGRLVTVSDAVWRSSDYNIATVDGTGLVTPRAPGSVTITGEAGPGIRATAAITVIPHRAVWEVDGHVTGAAIQLGTAAFPFEHPSRAFPFVTEGDTIHVAPGTYDFDSDGQLGVGVVIRGGTVGDTTTRPVFRDAQRGSNTALRLNGGQRAVVQNVAFKSFYYAIELNGVRDLAIEDGSIESLGGTFGGGIYSCISGTTDTVRVDRTTFVGDSDQSALDNSFCSPHTALVVVRDSKIHGFYQGISWTDVDSLVVLRSEISDNVNSGIEVGTEFGTTNPSVYVAHSRIERNGSTGVRTSQTRRVVVDSSVVTSGGSGTDALDLSGGCGECSGDVLMNVGLHGDSIAQNANGYSWLRVNNGDTVVVAGTIVSFLDVAGMTAYGNFDANVGRFTGSKFLNNGQGTTVQFQGSDFFADSLQFTGCSAVAPGCDLSYGIYLVPRGSSLDVRVRHSSFAKLYAGVYVAGAFPGVHEATNLVMDSVQYAITLSGDSALVADNQLTRVGAIGIQAGTGNVSTRSIVYARNHVQCTPAGGSQYGMLMNAARRFATTADTLENCNIGIYLNSLLSGSVVRGNTIRGGQYGIRGDQFLFDTIAVAVDSNGISGTSTAAAFYTGGKVLFTHNRVESNAQYGLQTTLSVGVVHDAHQNSFAGNAVAAILASGDNINAQLNWWNSPSGACTGGDCFVGPVDASNFLTSPPPGLPGLSPRPLTLMTTATATSGSSVTTIPVARKPVLPSRPYQKPSRHLSPRRRS